MSRIAIVTVEFDLSNRADEKPRSAAAFYIALGSQLIVSDDHRGARNTQFDGEAARWRQPMILLQLAINNALPHQVTNLGEQGNVRIPRQGKGSGRQNAQIGMFKLTLIGYFKVTKISINCK